MEQIVLLIIGWVYLSMYIAIIIDSYYVTTNKDFEKLGGTKASVYAYANFKTYYLPIGKKNIYLYRRLASRGVIAIDVNGVQTINHATDKSKYFMYNICVSPVDAFLFKISRKGGITGQKIDRKKFMNKADELCHMLKIPKRSNYENS